MPKDHTFGGQAAAARLVVDATAVVESRQDLSAIKRKHAIQRFASRVRRLPTFSEVFRTYRRPIEGADERLRRLAHRLNGRFVVANLRSSVTLPGTICDRLLEISGELSTVTAPASFEVRLEEPTDFVIRHGGARPGNPIGLGENAFNAKLEYRAHLLINPERANDAVLLKSVCDGIDQRSFDEAPWFRIALCIPDDRALERMSPDTALFYKWITGRLGGGSKDEYWHLDAWEQYTEDGRVGGIVVPEFLRLPPRASQPLREPTEPDPLETATSASSFWAPLTPAVERGALVPPGFCFVEFEGTISMRVSVTDPANARMRARL